MPCLWQYIWPCHSLLHFNLRTFLHLVIFILHLRYIFIVRFFMKRTVDHLAKIYKIWITNIFLSFELVIYIYTDQDLYIFMATQVVRNRWCFCLWASLYNFPINMTRFQILTFPQKMDQIVFKLVYYYRRPVTTACNIDL